MLTIYLVTSPWFLFCYLCVSSGLQASSGDDFATLDPMSFDISEIYLPSFSTFPESALTMFRAMFGDFDFNEFSGVRYEGQLQKKKANLREDCRSCFLR